MSVCDYHCLHLLLFYFITTDSGLIAEYEAASSERKLFLEKKYGTKTIRDMIETSYSEQWIRGNSKSCPHCLAAIEVLLFIYY